MTLKDKETSENKEKIMKDLRDEIASYKELKTKYLQVKGTNDELEKEVKALEYLSDKQESNLRNICRQKLLASQKNRLLQSNLDEASSACACLTLRPDEIASVDTAKYQVKAARLKRRLDSVIKEEIVRAKEWVRLETECAELERKYVERMGSKEGRALGHCAREVQDWTHKITKFRGITKLYDYLLHEWSTRGAEHENVDEVLLQKHLNRELDLLNNPRDGYNYKSNLTLTSYSQFNGS